MDRLPTLNFCPPIHPPRQDVIEAEKCSTPASLASARFSLHNKVAVGENIAGLECLLCADSS